MFDDRRAAACQDERNRGRDVEKVQLVAAGAANVNRRAGQPGGVDFRVHGPREQSAGEPGDFGGGFSLGAQGAQERGLARVGRGGIGQRGDGSFDLRGREFGRGGEGVEKRGERAGDARGEREDNSQRREIVRRLRRFSRITKEKPKNHFFSGL